MFGRAICHSCNLRSYYTQANNGHRQATKLDVPQSRERPISVKRQAYSKEERTVDCNKDIHCEASSYRQVVPLQYIIKSSAYFVPTKKTNTDIPGGNNFVSNNNTRIDQWATHAHTLHSKSAISDLKSIKVIDTPGRY